MSATPATTLFETAAYPQVEAPLEIPAAPQAHPLRWRKLLELLRGIRSAEDQVDAGLKIFDAVGGVGGEQTFQRFATQPAGRRMLREQPDLVALLGNRSWLAAMPDASLGRAYLAFAERNGFAADSLVEKNRSVEREHEKLDPYRQWFWDRYTMMHDLWHVVTGWDTTAEGEARLLAFSQAQTPQRGFAVLLGLIAVTAHLRLATHWRQWRAWRAGKRANPLLLARWEELLRRPLAEIRRDLRVVGAVR